MELTNDLHGHDFDPDQALSIITRFASLSITPTSHFSVVAIIVLADGSWHAGFNIEFADQPLSQAIHAEQSAVTNTLASLATSKTPLRGPLGALPEARRVEHIYVNALPCGYCRQLLSEHLIPDVLIHVVPLTGVSPLSAPIPLHQLLPSPFTASDLGVDLGSPQSIPPLSPLNPLAAPDVPPIDIDRALRGARQAIGYASNSPAGVCLVLSSGEWVVGFSYDAAAYSMSIDALLMALIRCALAERLWTDIERIVYVEVSGGAVSSRPYASYLLGQIAPQATLHYLSASKVSS